MMILEINSNFFTQYLVIIILYYSFHLVLLWMMNNQVLEPTKTLFAEDRCFAILKIGLLLLKCLSLGGCSLNVFHGGGLSVLERQ